MVGTRRLELRTPCMSCKCSNQLSYAPITSERCILHIKEIIWKQKPEFLPFEYCIKDFCEISCALFRFHCTDNTEDRLILRFDSI